MYRNTRPAILILFTAETYSQAYTISFWVLCYCCKWDVLLSVHALGFRYGFSVNWHQPGVFRALPFFSEQCTFWAVKFPFQTHKIILHLKKAVVLFPVLQFGICSPTWQVVTAAGYLWIWPHVLPPSIPRSLQRLWWLYLSVEHF